MVNESPTKPYHQQPQDYLPQSDQYAQSHTPAYATAVPPQPYRITHIPSDSFLDKTRALPVVKQRLYIADSHATIHIILSTKGIGQRRYGKVTLTPGFCPEKRRSGIQIHQLAEIYGLKSLSHNHTLATNLTQLKSFFYLHTNI